MSVRPGRRGVAAGLLVLALAAGAAHAGTRWGASAMLGTAWSLPTPLVIRQRGERDLRLAARWATRAHEFPLYYALRLERGDWALDFVHHKIYLVNPPPELEAFSVTHGYNLLILSRRWRGGDLFGSAGLGVVIAHPESRVRGRRFAERGGLLGAGYFIAGPVASLSIGRRAALDSGWEGLVEARVTAAYARVPVAEGSAEAPNLALHGAAGLGYAGR